MLFYVNASYSVCVFYVNASHFVSVFYVNAIVILFVNVMVEKLSQSKYPYLLKLVILWMSWRKNYCKLSTHICKCWSFCECPGERIIAT